MRVKSIPASWLKQEGLRLDCGPYMSGALEARVKLDSLKRTQHLHELTTGFNGGIYNGPQFSRRWVEDSDYGVPFVGSSAMLMADLSNLPLLQRKYAQSSKLSHLKLSPGMTLISCSGTIGRMVYVRPDMGGVWSSQHIMKVVPDKSKIPPGYLYAYLSSKFGVPLVVSGTYGAIIQHIEPNHIADLPVPRLGDKLEKKVHELVEEAASSRSKAIELLDQADVLLYQEVDILSPKPFQSFARPLCSNVSASNIRQRFDAYYYCEPNRTSREALDNPGNLKELDKVAEVFIPGIFKRKYADDPAFGHPYITGADVFQLAPTSERYLMTKVASYYNLLLKKGMILIQEAGQLSGIIGHSVPVGTYLDGFACTNNMVRVLPNDDNDTGYIFALLSSEHGVRLIAREAAGSSIPHIEVGRIRRLTIPWPDKKVRSKIGRPVAEAIDLRDLACELENKARELVEKVIEEAS